jgi:prepilin-type processing-associated H-X9-DG protein
MIAFSESRSFRTTDPSGGIIGDNPNDVIWLGIRSRSYGVSFVIELDPIRHGKNYNVLFCDGHVAPIPCAFFITVSNIAQSLNIDHQPHPETW